MAVGVNGAITRDTVIGVIQTTIGYILAIFFGLSVCMAVQTTKLQTSLDVTMILMCLALAVWGVFLVIRGAKRRKLIRLFREYAAGFACDPLHSIDQLAASKGITVQTAKKNILEMIQRGYFWNAHIDLDRNYLVFGQQINSSHPTASSPASVHSSMEFICVPCQGCGATNAVRKGVVKECDFCGKPLSVN